MYLASTFLALAVALSIYGYSKLNLQKVIGLLSMISKAMKESNKNSCTVKIENGLGHIEVGTKSLVLPAFKSLKHYDVICFKSHNNFELVHSDNHNLSLNINEENKIPFTLLRNNEHFIYVPFKPSDHNLSDVFVAIKHLTKDGYSVYKFEENDFVNFSHIVQKYEEDLLVESEKPITLAEVFEED